MNSNYINTLSYEEKIIFVKLLCKIVGSDGVVASEELDFLKLISARYGIDTKTTTSIIKSISTIDCKEEASQITDRQHALELIKELCVVANIDENLGDKELDVILDVAEAMGIEDEKVIVINRWVLDCLILNKTGRVIMEKDDE